jgi:hypothetical protein
LSGNLDRIQIIKGWLDAKGNAQEKVYNIVSSATDSGSTACPSPCRRRAAVVCVHWKKSRT